MLIGGAGADVVRGLGGEDVLIAGGTDYDPVAGTADYDADLSALGSVMTTWASAQGYDARRAALSQTLTAGNRAAVKDDGAADSLDGGADRDWAYARTSGNRNQPLDGRVGVEDVTAIS